MIIMRHLTPADPTLGFSSDNHPEESNNKPQHLGIPLFRCLDPWHVLFSYCPCFQEWSGVRFSGNVLTAKYNRNSC